MVLGLGFGLGVYLLPVLIAPKGPDQALVDAAMEQATYRTAFKRDLPGSDALHWADGKVSVGPDQVAFEGRMAPGPDYKVYLVPEYVDTIADFERVKATSVRIGEVKSFGNFLVDVPDGVDVEQFTTVVVWCETFSKFISAGQYRTGS